jgi:hypothetical protein
MSRLANKVRISPLAKFRLLTKDLIVLFGYGDLLIEYCDLCGIKQPLDWWSDDELYTKSTGREAGCDSGGSPCPICFDKLARERGVSIRWKPEEQ